MNSQREDKKRLPAVGLSVDDGHSAHNEQIFDEVIRVCCGVHLGEGGKWDC